jgi:predicted HAD superfamily Cof-like phosphohydrolase
MSLNMLEDLKAFRQRFGLGCPRVPQLLSNDALTFRQVLMKEELQEFIDATASGDLPEAADALIDLVYVTLGTALEMGLPWEALWNDVQRANMSKVRALKEGDSKRGSTYDVIKPSGWVPPQGATIIARIIAVEERRYSVTAIQQGDLFHDNDL